MIARNIRRFSKEETIKIYRKEYYELDNDYRILYFTEYAGGRLRQLRI